MAESLQQLADRGVQIGPGGQQYSIVSGNTYTPVAGGGDAPSPLRQPLTTMSLQQAQGQAEQAFSGLVAPMTLEDIRTREAQAKAGVAETATSIYDPNISREKQTGAAQVSTAEGVVGQRQGFNISTAEQAFVADVQNKVQDRVREVENIKASYISQGNLAAADRADSQLQALNEWNSQMTIAKANYALQLMAGNREQAQLELAQAQAKTQEAAQARQLDVAEISMLMNIPEGKTFEYNSKTYTGMKPQQMDILSNSEIISLMKTIPYGEEQSFNFNGQEYTVTGIDRANPNMKTIETTDASGNVVITTVDASTGNIINQVSAGRIGRSGSAGTSVNVQLKQEAKGPIQDTLYNMQEEIGTRAYNQQTGAWTYYDLQGNEIQAPVFFQTTKPKASSGSISLTSPTGATININR